MGKMVGQGGAIHCSTQVEGGGRGSARISLSLALSIPTSRLESYVPCYKESEAIENSC